MANLESKVEELTSDLDFENFQYQVNLETNHGNIRLNLFPDVAPNHCRNIIGLTRSGFYDGLIFHRVIKGFMIQGGCPQGSGTGDAGYKLANEFNSVSHEPGVLSMARAQDPDSAGSQFFVCLEHNDFLDGQYTAFGKAADDDSMSVVRTIGELGTDANDRPHEDATIVKATVEQVSKA